jgi:FkbM family methyltransferase
MKSLIAKLVFVRLRPFWDDLRAKHPTTHRMLSRASRVILPWSRRVWMRGEGGIAAGLYFKLNPRFERDFLGHGDDQSEKIWRDNLRPGGVFYDVGSHVGVFAVSGARMVGQEGAVYAFEPDPDNVRLIQGNARRNSLHVEVIAAAAWKSSGSLQFVRAAGSDPSRMGGHLVADEGLGPTISVSTVCLDDFAQRHRPPSFVKLDVEGAEAEVLEGARNTLLEHRPNLLIEIHNDEALRRVSFLLEQCDYHFECLVPGDRQFIATPKLRT